jgi:uncharacterized protein (TIGR02001 family)
MKTTIKLSAISLALLAGQAFAADPAPAWSVTGNVTVVSDYVFRGITQTQGKGMLQAGLDAVHSDGYYLGAFVSGVSWAAYNNGSKKELDLYGGYRIPMADGANFDVGLVTYWFPGAEYTAGSHTVKYNTQELKFGWNKGAFNVYGWLATSKHWSGFAIDPVSGAFHKSKGSTYIEANWNPEIMAGTVLNLHVGHQAVRNFSGYNFSDVKVGVTYTAGQWVFSAAGTHNTGKSARGATPYWRFFNQDGTWEYVAGSRFVATAAYTF